MAKANLTSINAQRLRELLHYDPHTGEFAWKVTSSNRAPAGSRAGGSVLADGYVVIGFGGRVYRAHRLAWFYVHGAWPEGEIDHINGVRSDNRLANLRDVSRRVNSQNMRGPRIDNTSGFMGVTRCRDTGRWRSTISIDTPGAAGKRYATPEEAHAAYLEAKRKHHAGCTI